MNWGWALFIIMEFMAQEFKIPEAAFMGEKGFKQDFKYASLAILFGKSCNILAK